MVLAAITRYCRYQERCHKEVRNKLYELGCTTPEVEQVIAQLIETDVLNEERFARAIARGKFRMKQWGRKKIIQQLKQQQVSEYNIRRAMTEIDSGEYEDVLQRLAEKKLLELRSDKNQLVRRAKTMRYLLQKGYEADMSAAAINKLISDKKTLSK